MANMAADRDLRDHEESYAVFRRIVLFAIVHIGVTVICVALAFLGDQPLISAVLAMLGTYVMHTTHGSEFVVSRLK